MILLFLSALMVGFSGAMMPGPILTYTIRQSLSVGRRAGFIMQAFNLFGIAGVVIYYKGSAKSLIKSLR